MIDASLNEVEGVAAKAARGAGLTWGLAEETAKAARWLAACGLEWAPNLAAMLDRHATFAAPASTPPAVLQAQRGAQQSPLLLGTFLDDLGATAGDCVIDNVAHPLWLLPFAARTADDIAAAVVLAWDGVTVTVWPFGGEIAGSKAALYADHAASVAWSHLPPGGTAATADWTLARADRSPVAAEAWQRLVALGARTYVPATSASRARGAGGGMTDVD